MGRKYQEAEENRQPQTEKPQTGRPQKEKPPKKDSDLKSYARYSGIAFQMIIIIGGMTFAGVKLDERRGGETPVFTIILSLLGVFAALYTTLKDFIGKK
ncbi:MAG: AtpZ/AtpI family protein [Bacteroidales bacterium]